MRRLNALFPYFLVVCSLLLSACERSYGRQACRMEREVLLARTDGVPGAVSVIPLGPSSYLAVWSQRGETQSVRFAPGGPSRWMPRRIPRDVEDDPIRKSAVGAAAKIGGRDDGAKKAFWTGRRRPSIAAADLSALSLGDGRATVAMVEQTRTDRRGGAYLAVLDEEGTAERVIHLGPAGSYANRIVSARVDDVVVVAWHEGRLGTSKINMTTVDLKRYAVKASATLEASGAVAAPTLAVKAGRIFLAWSENSARKGSAKSAVKIAPLSPTLALGTSRTLAVSRYVNPSPALAVSEDGLAIVFRDDEDDDDTPEYHFIPLDATGASRGERQRISTSDGLRGPNLVAGGDGYFGATIRSFQRNLLIGLNRMDRFGHKLGGEFQVYADKTDFVRVAIAENRGEVMIVYAEDRQNRGRVLAGAVVCAVRN